ncbi:MAG: inositol monophosphatase [Muribaculaceae bacterium]|nr:inositol monophosphatase [Muribaculaceae bacterium]
MCDCDIKKLVDDAIAWAREAGEVQLKYFRSSHLNIRAKFNDSDIVTVADKASEQVIINNINRTYPQHAILSEEMGGNAIESDYRWIIDPLDGTTNFSNGLPLFSVSIAVEYQGEVIVGVVYAPYLDEMFHAVKGGGAWLNGKPIAPSGKESLSHSVVTTGFPVDKDTTTDNNLDNVSRVLPRVRGMRRLGSAAIDLCYVAAGFLDGYWEMNLHTWDVAAGQLIVQEAGACYSHFRTDRNISVVAATPLIFETLYSLLASEAPK